MRYSEAPLSVKSNVPNRSSNDGGFGINSPGRDGSATKAPPLEKSRAIFGRARTAESSSRRRWTSSTAGVEQRPAAGAERIPSPGRAKEVVCPDANPSRLKIHRRRVTSRPDQFIRERSATAQSEISLPSRQRGGQASQPVARRENRSGKFAFRPHIELGCSDRESESGGRGCPRSGTAPRSLQGHGS